MSRAKHRDKIARREHEAFIKRVEREDAQKEMRKAHKEFKRSASVAQRTEQIASND